MAKKTQPKKKVSAANTTKKKATRTRSKDSQAAVKGKQWTFPKNSLEEALSIAKAIEEKNAGNPMKSSILVKAVGFNQSNDWRFLDLLRSANQYGLVSGTGANATVRLEKIGEDIVAPSSSAQRQKALVAAFRNVDEFARVESFYGGKRIPEDEFFENTLVREFNIPRERVRNFKDVFGENLKYLNLYDAYQVTSLVDEALEPSLVPETEAAKKPTPKTRVREFLDTCFVMMPFGDWFDRYYKEIYVPAIKEAGFEPVRADELFSTGSVVEQIWEQIGKSPVLLADLTDKNANVFYELGLAHAANKPVVFTAARVEDVPFDLRHLRVIIYDVREPDWAAKLSKNVTGFLKNAKSDPAKSIPQPFRAEANVEI